MDELPPNARDLIEAARHADDPSAADRARIDAKARARFAAMGVTVLSPPAGLETAQAAGGAGGQTAAGAGAQGGAAAAAATGAATATKVVATAVIAGAVAFGAVRGLQTAEPEPATGPRLEAVTVSATGPVPVTEPDSATEPEIEPEPATESGPVTASEPASSAEGSRPRRRLRARRTRDEGVADDGRLAAEVALIGRVHDALQAGHHAQALRLLRAHREGFAEGALAQERRGLRVLALCGAGRLAEGRRLRRRFLSAAPGSLLAARVRGACGGQ
ncbi:MAG: hypothetical protein PVI30_25350 [Myxococcales bacterium]